MPAALYLNNLKREDNTLILTGLADNPNVVSSLIRNLDASKWMGNSAVRNIQQNISAYQPAPALNTGKQSRPTYPEDSYVQFVITTQVQSQTANTDDGAETGGEL